MTFAYNCTYNPVANFPVCGVFSNYLTHLATEEEGEGGGADSSCAYKVTLHFQGTEFESRRQE